MARYTYQGVITPPSPSVAIVADAGDITDRSGTYYFWMQVRNRAGFSAVSPSVSAVVTVNARVDITIPSNLIPVANGMYIHSIYILANTTNNPATATIVCGIPYYELDEVTPRSLPVTIQLGADHHFELGKEVDYYSELPVNPCAGQRVYVEQDDRDDPTVDFNTIVEYQPFAAVPGWYEAFDQEFSTYLSDPTTASGALASISAASRVIPTLYTLGISANDRSPSRPIGIWLINDAAQPISVGTRVGMSFAIGEDNVSADFVGRMQIIFRGYVNTATGVNNTSDGDGGTMLLINEPIDYSGETIEVLKLQKEVPVGYAVWLDVRAISTLEELNNRAPIGARIKISPYFFSFRSTQTPPDLFGGYIADAQDRRLIVPGTGLTAKALRGSGKVQFNSLGTAFTFWNAEEQTIASLASNTADQSIVITKEGNCLLLDDVTNTTQLRAIVGTVNGVGAPSDWSSPIALNGSQRLGFTITHPVSFRDDYPDSLLAGQSYATYNGYGFRIYIRLVGGAASYWDVTTNTGSLTTAITIGGTAGVVGEPAIPGDTYFGLHLVDTFATALSTASTVFAAGSYEVCVAPIYQGTVSSINNDPDDGIITIRTTFAETLERSTYWLSAISDPLTLRSFTGERRGGMRVPLNNSSSFFYWDSANTDADDGVDTIAVTGVATGRFKRFVNLNTLDPGAGVVLDGILEAEIGDEFRLLAPIASFVLATNAVPTAGQLGTNNVAYASVTTLRPYEDGSINNILNTIVAGTIVVVTNAVTRFYYNVTAIADSGSYRSFTVTYLGYRGSVAAWTNGETIVLSIVQTSASVIALIDGAIGTAWKTDPATLTPDDLDDTSTANKFITAAELVKLAGIETGATADQLAADVPTAGSFTNFTPSSANVQAALAAIDTEIGVLSGNAVGDGDKGDITVTTGGTVWTIDPQAVTYAKIQNVTAQRLLGRSSSTAGTIEEIQIGGGLSLAGGVLQNTVAASYTNLAIAARTSTAFQVTSSTGVAADIPQATNSLAGLLNAADKTKLDTVQTNATPDTKQVFVDAIDTVPSFLDRKFLEGTGITLTYSTNAILGRQITFANEWVNGAYSIKFQAPTIAADYTYTLPANYGTDGYVLKTNGSGTLTWGAEETLTIADEGSSLPVRATLNFVGAGVTATDDAGNNRTIVTIPGGGGSGGGGSGGGQYEYVATVTATGGESYLEFTGLTESHYSLFGSFQLSESNYISIFANGNTTNADYRRQRLWSIGTVVNADASSSAYIGYAYASPSPFGNIYLKLGREPRGFFYAHCESVFTDNGFSFLERQFLSVYSASTIASLTSIRFSPLSGTFSAGSVFYLYKLVTALDTVQTPVDEIWINAGMIVPDTINGATENSYSTTIATYDVLDFNQTIEQDGFFTIVFGQKWNAGTIKAKFYWIASAGTGDCIWGIQAVSVSSATNLDQTFGTAQEVTQTLSAVDQLLISSATAAITIGNTPAVDDLIQFRVYRKAAAGGDTLSGTASLIGVEIQYTQVQTGVAW